jgi:hypothetical protein
VRDIDVDVKRQVGLAYSAARPPSEVLQKFIARLQGQRRKTGRAKPVGKAGKGNLIGVFLLCMGLFSMF